MRGGRGGRQRMGDSRDRAAVSGRGIRSESGGEQDALAEQIQFGAAEHLPLEHLYVGWDSESSQNRCILGAGG